MASAEEYRLREDARRRARNERRAKKSFRSLLATLAFIGIVSWPWLFTSADSQCDGSAMPTWIFIYEALIIVPLTIAIKYGKWFFGYSCMYMVMWFIIIFAFIGAAFSC